MWIIGAVANVSRIVTLTTRIRNSSGAEAVAVGTLRAPATSND